LTARLEFKPAAMDGTYGSDGAASELDFDIEIQAEASA
jgi:hypothetical protein